MEKGGVKKIGQIMAVDCKIRLAEAQEAQCLLRRDNGEMGSSQIGG